MRLSDSTFAALFSRSAQKGKLRTIERLLARGGDPGQIHPNATYGLSPLMLAAEFGHANCVKALIPHCDPNAVDKHGLNALMRAASMAHLDCLLLLIPVSDTYLQDASAETSLMIAVKIRSLECAQALLPFSDSHAVDFLGQTALMHACYGYSNPACAKLLIPFSNLDARARSGSTAMDIAARSGAIQCLEILLPFHGTGDMDALIRAESLALPQFPAASGLIAAYASSIDEREQISADCHASSASSAARPHRI